MSSNVSTITAKAIVSLILTTTVATSIAASPYVKILPNEKTIKHNLLLNTSPVTLTCQTVRDSLITNLSWYDPREIRISSKSGRIFVTDIDQSLVLKISQSTTEDAGVYTCRGVLTTGQITQANISLQLYWGIKVTSPDTQSAILHSDAKIICQATASFNLTFTWYKDKIWSRIKSGDRFIQQTDHLLIKNITVEDEGVYICNIDLLEYGESKAHHITVNVTDPPKLNSPMALHPPTPLEGDEVQLLCSARGRPLPVYRFLKNGIPLTDYNSKSYYSILSANRSSNGLYTCEAKNTGGIDNSTVYLSIYKRPVIHDFQEFSRAQKNDWYRITCMATGDPRPVVTWRRKDQDKIYQQLAVSNKNSDSHVYVNDTAYDKENSDVMKANLTLIFKEVKPDDILSEYVCRAENTVGYAEKMTWLTDVRYGPFISKNTSTFFCGRIGGTTKITCKVHGNPEPAISWHYKGLQLLSQDPYDIQKEPSAPRYQAISYLIPSVRENNSVTIFGLYVCKATNQYGSIEQILEFKEGTVPDQPTAYVSKRFASTLEIRIRDSSSNANCPAKHFDVIYKTVNSSREITVTKETNEEYTQFRLRDLIPNTQYVIEVSSVNDVGRSAYVTVMVVTRQFDDVSGAACVLCQRAVTAMSFVMTLIVSFLPNYF